MNSTIPTPIITTTTTTTLPNFSPALSSTQSSNLHRPKFKFHQQNERNPVSKSIQCVHNRDFSPHPSSSEASIRNPCALGSCLAAAAAAPAKASEQLVADKAKRLVLEFKSLSEPIDRVKRLLHYAANLPPCKESAREPESRVPGCATQVWVEAELDELGRMRFRADSDSEISKGFCSCLIWMLDGRRARGGVGHKAPGSGGCECGSVRQGQFQSQHVAQRAVGYAEKDSGFAYGVGEIGGAPQFGRSAFSSCCVYR
ncbi:hypothetical protein M0R45_021755 [Rubus argutus]|uniref:Fe-S metabolism associated domain-containing protein n=1 Tax=Rubus argutus TaxID=59490 RepID=A0AAW1XFB2_RUBAR